MAAPITSGPWTVGGENDLLVFGPKGELIANCYSAGGALRLDEMQANARAIAALPDLLKGMAR